MALYCTFHQEIQGDAERNSTVAAEKKYCLETVVMAMTRFCPFLINYLKNVGSLPNYLAKILFLGIVK